MSPLDRAGVPASGALRDFEFPEVERRTLPSGVDLRVAKLNRLPVVNLNLFMRAGEDGLSSENAGLASLAADALEGGTKRRSGSELAGALERIGARVSASAGWEGTSLAMSCLADRLPGAFQLLSEAVLEPDFPEAEVERAREQQLAGIRQRLMDPSSLATDSALARYFASDVPYARPVDGSVDSLSGMSRNDLRGYVDSNYRPETGGLIVVGDVDPGEVQDMVVKWFGEWAGEPVSRADFVVEPATRERRVVIVHRPGSVQSEIRVGHVGAARSTPDYFPLSIANMVLGGMFTSRLNLNLRERNGFTYGVRSRFGFRSKPGSFQVSTAVGNEVTADAVREIMHELTSMAESGPTDEEVKAARDYAAGIFGLQLETSGQVATRVSQLVVYGLRDDYFDRYRDEVRAVTTEAAAEAASRHIRPAEAQIVLVGDAEIVGPEVEALGFGAPEVVPAA